MAAAQAQNITFDSITVLNHSSSPVDRIQPLSFIQWLPYNSQNYTTPENSLKEYQVYINTWYQVTGASFQTQTNAVQNLYLNLINEIAINYTTVDEQRYINNIDYTNSRDLAIAVPFFAKKIKDICIYYSTLRDDVQTATIQFNLKGSKTGIETLLFNNIAKALQSQDLISTITSLNLSLSSIIGSMSINVEDIYDLYPNYFDVTPTLPASAYNVTEGLRNEYFKANQVTIDPFATLDFNQSIAAAIAQYPTFTKELGSQLTVNPIINPGNLSLLKDSDFIPTVNTGLTTDLNIQNNLLEQSKYIGADFYYVITDTTLTSFTSGQLFKADSEFANVLNKRYPSIAAIPSQEFLQTATEVGLFFKPDKIGLLHFTNFNFTASVNLNNLTPNTVYYFPDPKKYGNVISNTQQNFVTPFNFFENNYFNKVDASNQNRFGDVASDPYYQLFRSYQSREQSLNYSNFGVSRYTDYQDFFTGSVDNIWNNVDVYPNTPAGLLPVDYRQQELLTLNKTLIEYKNDIYGNEYSLYKNSFSIKSPLSSALPPSQNIKLIFDGNVMLPSVYNNLAISLSLDTGTFVGSGSNAFVDIQSYGFATEFFPLSTANLSAFSFTEPSTFVNTRVPNQTTILDYSLTGTQINQSIYHTRNIQYGDIYVRNSNSSIIAPISAALSAVYTKYTAISSHNTTISNEINTSAINIDVFYDVIQIETQNHLLFDKIGFNYTNNIPTNLNYYSILDRGYNHLYEKFSNSWFDETNKQLIVCQTKVFYSLSATNNIIIYPKIYNIDLNTAQSTQLYPTTRDSSLTVNLLSSYSLSSTNLNLQIVEIEKPLLSYNKNTNIYNLTYLGKDTAAAIYIFDIRFKCTNNTLSIISNTIYTPTGNTAHQNFAGSILPTLSSYSNIGNYSESYFAGVGYIDVDNTFTFGNRYYLLLETNGFLLQETGSTIIL
jgi:hypothetical protein